RDDHPAARAAGPAAHQRRVPARPGHPTRRRLLPLVPRAHPPLGAHASLGGAQGAQQNLVVELSLRPMSLVAELRWRGLVDQVPDPGLERILAAGAERIYGGCDPTADSLHVGSLIPILALVRAQRA